MLEERPFRLQAWQIGMIVSISMLVHPVCGLKNCRSSTCWMAMLKGGSAYPPALLRGNLFRHPLHTDVLIIQLCFR